MTSVLVAHLLMALVLMTSSSAGDDRDCIGTSGVTSLKCELSQCFTDDKPVLYVRPRCRSPRYIHITQLIFGLFATRHCSPSYNSCCINQTTDSWDPYRPQHELFVNMSRRCNGRRHCELQVDRATIVTSQSQQLSSDYVIIGFDCVTNDASTGFTEREAEASTLFGLSYSYVVTVAVVAVLLVIIIILIVVILVTRRRRANSRRSSRRLNAASRTAQAKLSVSNLYDLYDSIEMPYSPSVLAPSTPTSIIKHSELLNALPPSEYVPMKAGKARKSSPTHWLVETNLDVGPTSSVYVSTPGTHQEALRRPASIQLVDHYEEIPADLTLPPNGTRRHASCDNLLHIRPQPPTPRQGHSEGQRSTEASADRRVVDTMTRKPSYDDNDVILIDSDIYG